MDVLDAVVLVVTRSIDEAEDALKRSDGTMIWGVGCHPGLARVQRAFDAGHFRTFVATTPNVGELDLDGASRGPMQM